MKSGRPMPDRDHGPGPVLGGSVGAMAQGDGGTLRAWEQHGRYDIAVFTEPNPVVTGPVDISVLLLDRETGTLDRGCPRDVEVAPEGRPDEAIAP